MSWRPSRSPSPTPPHKGEGFFVGLALHAAGVIAIDPPWSYKSNSAEKPGRNARRHYRCMSLDAIASLPVGELAAEHCAALLWIPAPFLAVGAQGPILKAWGFKPSTICLTWVKTTADGRPLMRKGHTTRIDTEFVVLGRRGRPRLHSRRELASIVAPAREHSRKPDEFYARAERLYGDAVRYDLFSREDRPGWISWGDEAGKFNGEGFR